MVATHGVYGDDRLAGADPALLARVVLRAAVRGQAGTAP
jgi:hypothetical protein